MLKYLLFLFFGVLILSSTVQAQYSKSTQKKLTVAPRVIPGYSQPTFYQDFQRRKVIVNRVDKGTLGEQVEMLADNWDWPSNQITPPHSFAADFFGTGVYYPVLVETGNSDTTATGTAQRYAEFSYMDDFGVGSYYLYGTDEAGFPIRTGWDTHMLMDEATNKIYVSIYDFLNPNGLINNHLWEIDLAVDPNTATQLTSMETALPAGWPRIALDGNGIFWMLHDIDFGASLGIAASTDGGHTFELIDSIGSNDETFWGSEFSNDPMLSASGDKISTFNFVTRGGNLALLGLDVADLTNPDSASGIYHWYSTDGGNSWQGDWIAAEGDTFISNRHNYEPLFASYSTGSQFTDPTGVTHLIYGDGNTPGLNDNGDTVNVYAPVYWNDNNKEFISLELPEVETYPYDRTLMDWGNLMALRPFVKADPTGRVVVAMWNRVQFTGTPGDSEPSIYEPEVEGDVPAYNFDIVYSYSTDGGATWSTPEIASSSAGESYVYPNIAAVEVNEISRQTHDVTVHFTYCWDMIPGHGALTGGLKNSKSINPYYYETLTFEVALLSAGNPDARLNDYSLEQNYPNPFNPSTQIKYTIPERSEVTIKVFDILGREVATLVNSVIEAGTHEINFDAANLASGLYIYTIDAGSFTSSKKMMLLK